MTTRYKSGHIFEQHGTWYVRYYEKGGKPSRPIKALGIKAELPTMKRVREKAADVMRQVNEAAKVIYFRDLCAEYIKSGMAALREYTANVRKKEMKPLQEKWSDWRLDDLFSARGIVEIEEWLKSLKLAGTTRSRYRMLLGLMAKLANKREWINADQYQRVLLVDAHNFPAFTKPKRLKVPLTVEQYRALLSAEMPEVCKMALQICTETGMRACEAFGLKVEDVDFAHLKFHIRRSVKGKYIDEPKTPESKRTEPFDEEIAARLEKWIKGHPRRNGWLFESPMSKHGTPWTAYGLANRYLRPTGIRLGIPNLGWHTFRHTARSWMRKLDIPIEQQSMFMGHTNPEQTMRYGVDGVDRAEDVRPAATKLLEFARRKTG